LSERYSVSYGKGSTGEKLHFRFAGSKPEVVRTVAKLLYAAASLGDKEFKPFHSEEDDDNV
jgi:hypothetical protein